MRYIFPQIQELDFSETTRFYAIKDIHKVIQKLNHIFIQIK